MAEKSRPSADNPPSYSESVDSASRSTPSIPRNIAQARTALISDLISTQITPRLHTNALSGLSNMTLLIVPTNVSSLQSSQSGTAEDKSGATAASPTETILGFPSTDNVALIRLQGQENSFGFWTQSVVISELWERLCSQLQGEGYRVARGCQYTTPEDFGIDGSGQSPQITAPRTDWSTIQKEPLQAGEANVEVGVQEISLRIESLMGLYETKNGKAVVVKVEIGG